MRLLRPRGRTAFFTVHVTAGLSKRDHRRAVGAGPRAVASRRDHRSLLQAAGFIEIEEGDVTDEFLATAERWVRFSRQLEPELRALQGAEAPGARCPFRPPDDVPIQDVEKEEIRSENSMGPLQQRRAHAIGARRSANPGFRTLQA